jgi:MarR family transcriptional regulator for hemolysin
MPADSLFSKAQRFSDLGRLVPAVGQAWRRVLGQRLCGEGLSDATALPVLVLFRAGTCEMRQRELAQQLGLEGSAVVRLLDSLEQRGLVRRVEDPKDRRAKLLDLTSDGIALAERVSQIAVALRLDLFRDISEDEIEVTYRVLYQLSQKLDELGGGAKG